MNNVVLSVDSEVMKNPSIINFDEDYFDNKWLKTFSNAEEFRNYIKTNKSNLEIWVLSNDDIEAINLAAAVKKDRNDCIVCLICYEISGSLKSRAKAAKIDSIFDIESLKERIEAIKKKNEIYNKKRSSKSHNNRTKFELNNVPKSLGDTTSNKKAFILSILSASGGSGKSSVSAVCSLLLKVAGLKTLIIDADFQFGDIKNLLEAKDALRIDELIKDQSKITKLSCSENLPCVLAAPKYPEYAEKIIELFPNILDHLRSYFDVIVVNTGSFWTEQQALLLEKDSKSLFLIDQRSSSINATKKAIDLCERCGIAVGSVLFAINKCSKQSLFSSIDISCALDGANVAEIMDGGTDVDEFLTTGSSIDLIKTKNSFAVSLWTILESIMPENVMSNSSINATKQKNKNNKTKRFFRRNRA